MDNKTAHHQTNRNLLRTSVGTLLVLGLAAACSGPANEASDAPLITTGDAVSVTETLPEYIPQEPVEVYETEAEPGILWATGSV